jgi:hypothetical protein
MAEDKVVIGLSLEANKIADILEETGYFEDKLSIAKFAFGYAIKNGFDLEISEYKIGEPGGTKWNIGSVDNDQYLREFIVSLYPETDTPYRHVEALMNAGLISIGKFIEENRLNRISDLM